MGQGARWDGMGGEGSEDHMIHLFISLTLSHCPFSSEEASLEVGTSPPTKGSRTGW